MIKMKKSRLILALVSMITAAVLVTAGGLYTYMQVRGMTLVPKDDYETLADMGERYGKLYSLETTLEEKCIYDFDREAAMDAVYRIMADAVGDEYTAYFDEEELKAWTSYTEGTFTGVGVSFIEDDSGKILITSVLEEGPADGAGIKKGDQILKVDGKKVSDAETAKKALRGEEGSTVELTYQRDGKTKTVKLVRGQVEEISVYGGVLDEQYGYIAISAFEKNTAEQFRTELSRLENKALKGLIVDLRGNPGGLVEQSVEIADMLLPEGTITYTENKQGEKEYYNSDENYTKMKYVVLTDKNSASSSEILAAAVKDNKGGTLVGTTTYGKGVIQGLIEFNDGTALRLTYMQYFSPKGKKIQGVGVEPDYLVEQTADAKTDKQLEKAIALLK